MTIRIICGPAGSGKTVAAIETFLGALDGGGSPLFIAPSAPDARHFLRRILRQRPVLTSGSVTTFDQVAGALLSQSGYSLKVLSPTERFMLLKAVVEGSGRLEQLEASAGSDGFVAALAALIDELEGAGIDPLELAAALRSWAGGQSWRQGLNKDLYRLYQEYRGLLEDRSVSDMALAERQAAQNLRLQPELWRHDTVVIDGFWDFTPLQMGLIEAIEAAGAQLIITLPWQPGKVALAAPGLQRSALLALGGEAEQLPAIQRELPPVLAHLNEHLFEEAPPPLAATETVTLLTAAGVRGQAELVAAELLKLWRSGRQLDDMAVVCRSQGPDLAALATALAEFGIPCEADMPLPLSQTPLGQTLLAALDFTVSGDRSSLLGYLRSPLVIDDEDTVDRFDRLARVQSLEERTRLLAAWEIEGGRPLEELDHLLRAAAAGVGLLASELGHLARTLVSSRLKQEAIAAAELELELLSLKSFLAVCREAADLGDGILQPRGSAVASPTLLGVNQSAAFLCSGIKAAQVRLPAGNRRGCVRLLDPHRVLNQNFDIVFICGLLEGQFPSAGREDAFFPEADRRQLRQGFALPLGVSGQRLTEERFLFHRSLNRARERVYLCYPYCDSEGKPAIRSLFVDDVLDLFEPGSWGHREKKISELAFPAAEAPTSDQALLALALLGSADGAALSRERLLAVAGANRLAERLAPCLAAPARPRFVLSDPEARARLAGCDTFKATELERYLACPFLYFVEQLVRPADMQPEHLAISRGNILHKVLRKFSAAMARARLDLASADEAQIEEAQRQMAALLDEEFERQQPVGSLGAQTLKRQLYHYLARFIEREQQNGRQFEPYAFELSFGARSNELLGATDAEALLRIGDIKLRGRIDRVDLHRNTVRAMVIDYKSLGATPQAKFSQQGRIQLPIYMMAARDIWGLEPVGGEYYALLKEERRGLYLDSYREEIGCGENKATDFVDEEAFAERLEEARNLAQAAGHGIQAADFSPRPRDPKFCEQCGLGGLCRRRAAAPPGEGTDG